MEYYYICYSFIFTIYFLLDNENQINFKNLIEFEHKDKKVFCIEIVTKLTFFVLLTFFIIATKMGAVHANYLYLYLSILFQLISLILFIVAKKTMRRNWAMNITNNQETLSTTGVFAFSRNPVYLSYHILFISTLFLNFFIFIGCYIVFTISFHILILQEEKYLKMKFQDEYIDYCNSVRRYF